MSEPLHLASIEVVRARGVPRDLGWSLRDLSPGFNLIHGPNGSGKTTTAWAVQELLWPGCGALPRATLGGELRRGGGGSQRLAIEGGHLVGSPSDVGAADRRPFYWLAFDDLIKADDADVAREVRKLMLGGYDLDEAGASLDFAARPIEPRAKYDAFVAASERVREAETTQRQLAEEEGRLGELRRDLDAAASAVAEAERHRRALAHRRAVAACQAVQARLDAMPDAVAKLDGRERAELEAWAEAERQVGEEIAAARSLRAKAIADREAAGADDVATGVVEALRGERSRARDAEHDLDKASDRLAEARAAERAARQRLGGEAEPAAGERLRRVALPELNRLARKLHEADARQAQLDAERAQLDLSSQNVDTPPATALAEGLATLGHWLAEPAAAGDAAGTRRRRIAVVGLALAVVVLVACLALLVHAAWLIALPAAAIAWWAWPKDATGVDARAVHRATFERLGLASPQRWDADGVAAGVAALHGQLAARRAADEHAQRRVALDAADADHAAKAKHLDAERRAVAADLGVDLSADDAMWLPTLVATLQAWHAAGDAATAAEAARDEAAGRLDTALSAVGRLASPLGFVECGSSAEAEAIEQAIVDRLGRAVAARRDLEQADRDEQAAAERLADLGRKRASMLDRLGTDAATLAASLADWERLRDERSRLAMELSEAIGVRNAAAAELRDEPGLLERDEASLKQALADAETRAADGERLRAQIVQVQTRVADAKRGHDLADALAAREAARAALDVERDRCRRQAAGAATIAWLRDMTAERDQPAVLKRANTLLARVTSGALQLAVEHGAEARFVAVKDGERRELSAVSLGERTQVLMAARLAFIEHNEPTPLPLILDEVLANADDRRADLLIDTLLDFAWGRPGDDAPPARRQVFCFTAQRDEAGKWQAKLDERRKLVELPFKRIDLAEVRTGQAAANAMPAVEIPERLLPPADGHDHETFGRALAVPALPFAAGLAHAHAWYVVHEVAALRAVLAMGVDTARRVEVLLSHAGASGLPQLGEREPRVRAALRLLDALDAAHRVGRPPVVTAEFVESSGAITGPFAAGSRQVLAHVDGDGRRFLAGVAALPRWQQRKTADLEAELRDAGHLADVEPLSPDDVRGRLLAAAASALHDGHVEPSWVDRLLAWHAEATASKP